MGRKKEGAAKIAGRSSGTEMGRPNYGMKQSFQGTAVPDVLQAYKLGLKNQEARDNVGPIDNQGQEKVMQGNVHEVNDDEETKEREVEEAKEKEEDGRQILNEINQDETNGETQAVLPQKMQRKRKNEDGQNEERRPQEGVSEEEGEVSAVHSENDGSNPRRDDEGVDAEMEDEDSAQGIVTEIEKLGTMFTTWAPKIEKTEMRYLFLRNLGELRLETVESLGGG